MVNYVIERSNELAKRFPVYLTKYQRELLLIKLDRTVSKHFVSLITLHTLLAGAIMFIQEIAVIVEAADQNIWPKAKKFRSTEKI